MNKIHELLLRIKEIWNLPTRTEAYYMNARAMINAVDEKINERTTVHADIHWRGQGAMHQIIVVGKYGNKDYVRCFDIEASDWLGLVRKLQEAERNAKVGRFDMPHVMPFSAVYERDRF